MKYLFVAALAVVLTASASAQSAPASTPPVAVGTPHVCSDYYPADATPAEGTTLVQYAIGTDGHTEDVQVIVPSGVKQLDEAASTCVSHWEFQPATEDGQPIRVSMSISLHWSAPAK